MTATATSQTGSASPADNPGAVFIARQPILDRQQRCYAYELLFRGSFENVFPSGSDGDKATRCTVNTGVNLIGLDDLIGNKRGFVNITRALLVERFYEVLPADRAVIELLEEVQPDQEVARSCQTLRDAGYMLALDDFVLRPGYDALLAIADVVKVDYRLSTVDQRREVVEQYRRPGLSFLAEKVETQDEFAEALRFGYDYFQGYFFAKPQVVEGQDIPANKLNYFLFLRELVNPSVDFEALAQIIKREASLLVKLLRYLNSAALGVRERVTSIHQALALLGERQLRRWGSLVAATCMGEDKPLELMRLCMARARFCELMAPHLGMPGRDLDLFLMGLLSAIDAVLNYPLAPLLARLPLPADIKAALIGDNTELGKLTLLIQACEHGHWKNAQLVAGLLKVDQSTVATAHLESITWADRLAEF